MKHKNLSIHDSEAPVVNMTDETKNPINRVDPSTGGKFHAFWRGQMAYENGRVKRFATEGAAWDYLAQCELAGKIIH
jgi:hypothetical protein